MRYLLHIPLIDKEGRRGVSGCQDGTLKFSRTSHYIAFLPYLCYCNRARADLGHIASSYYSLVRSLLRQPPCNSAPLGLLLHRHGCGCTTYLGLPHTIRHRPCWYFGKLRLSFLSMALTFMSGCQRLTPNLGLQCRIRRGKGLGHFQDADWLSKVGLPAMSWTCFPPFPTPDTSS